MSSTEAFPARLSPLEYQPYNGATRCYLKSNGQLIARILQEDGYVSIVPAKGTDHLLKETAWRNEDVARAALECLAVRDCW